MSMNAYNFEAYWRHLESQVRKSRCESDRGKAQLKNSKFKKDFKGISLFVKGNSKNKDNEGGSRSKGDQDR